MPADAITVLKADHREIRRLFRQYRHTGSRAIKARAKIVQEVIELLTVHTYIENQVLYPQVRALLPKLKDGVLESYEEHHVADVLCEELAAMTPADEHFNAKATVLIENVTHHIEEEEGKWFPKVRKGLKGKQLRELAEMLEDARIQAPRRPVPSPVNKPVTDILTSSAGNS